MCLAVPGKVVELRVGESPIERVGTVDFQGSRLEVSFVLTPEVAVSDWVLVHAGFALQVLDEAEARKTWDYLSVEDVAEFSAETSGG